MSLVIGAGLFGIDERAQEAEDARDEAVDAKTTATSILNNIGVFSPGSVASLRTRPGLTGTRVEMTGYYGPGDGGGGLFYWDATSTAADDGAMTIKVAGTDTGRYRRIASSINVKMFGAKGDGIADDSAAIQAAVNYARSIAVANGGNTRTQVFFPSGIYRCNKAIDCTNVNGLWLVGGESRYVTVQINGNTGGIIFDFAGGINSGCKGFTFLSDKNESKPSTIGVLFALTNLGGLNCGIKDCYFQMDDNQTANGTLGTIGVLNVRAEEFGASDLYIKATSGMIFSNQADLSPLGVNFTVSSPFATLASGSGSMGVVEMGGQMSINNVNGRRPAITLLNANGVHFHGYLVQLGNVGGNNTAIRLAGQADNIDMSGTIEGFSQICRYANLNRNIRFNFTMANQNVIAENVYNLTGSNVADSRAVVTFNNPGEINGANKRVLVYHDPTLDVTAPGAMQNCEWICNQWQDNRTFVSANLLRNANNSRFLSSQPFEKKNKTIHDLKDYTNTLGAVTSGNPVITASILRFLPADKATTNSGNGGFYRAKITGVVALGSVFFSGGNCTAAIEGTVIVAQSQNGVKNGQQQAMSIIAKSATSQAYLDITAVSCSLDFSGPFPAVKLSVTNTGSGVNEPCTFTGRVELTSDFLVNCPIPFD